MFRKNHRIHDVFFRTDSFIVCVFVAPGQKFCNSVALKTFGCSVPHNLGMACVRIGVLYAPVFCVNDVCKDFFILLLVDGFQSGADVLACKPLNVEHLPYLEPSPVVVTQLVVGVCLAIALVIDVSFINQVIYKPLSIVGWQLPLKGFCPNFG